MSNLARNTNSQLSKPNTTEAAIEKVILKGDLRSLTEIERVQYNFALCQSLGLNPVTRPVDYIESDGKLQPYVNSVGIAQLRARYSISIQIVRCQKDEEFVYTTARATDRSGRSEEATAVVPLCDRYGKPLSGTAKANAIMKAETKSKRRATLALCGIPWGDSGNIQSSQSIDPPEDLLPDEMPF